MEKTKLLRHIIGYIIGPFIFILLIPYGLYLFSRIHNTFFYLIIMPNNNIRNILTLLLLIIGIIFLIWSNIFLLKIGKGGPTDAFNVAISPRTEKLVIVGPYKYTRNPMVFGAFMLYLGISIYLNSLACFILLIICIFLGIIYLKLTEEKRLLEDFGEEYELYKEEVEMIIPLKFKKLFKHKKRKKS